MTIGVKGMHIDFEKIGATTPVLGHEQAEDSKGPFQALRWLARPGAPIANFLISFTGRVGKGHMALKSGLPEICEALEITEAHLMHIVRGWKLSGLSNDLVPFLR
ncbi:hypothetical protein PoB_002231400 [Plakobranchus ocellatus]|uniref:Uncharacterized protein n=1 Tax=Plakobranchus ocellatus TaxID=259542 RepID=A0AAV3ZN37_9GAST|nr:hypothetical protein PoB_002231400 [Plakobranchus ocellatus]